MPVISVDAVARRQAIVAGLLATLFVLFGCGLFADKPPAGAPSGRQAASSGQ